MFSVVKCMSVKGPLRGYLVKSVYVFINSLGSSCTFINKIIKKKEFSYVQNGNGFSMDCTKPYGF